MINKKRKKEALVSVLLSCCLLLSACAAGERTTEGSFQNGTREQRPETEYDREELIRDSKEQQAGVPEADAVIGAVGSQEGKYAYSCLAENEKQLYLEILYILQGFLTDAEVSSVQEKELAYVFQCVMNDHPELFYVEGYTFTKFTVGGRVTKITLSGTYTMSKEEAGERLGQIEQKAQECLAGLPAEADEYEKVKYVYEYLILNTQYNVYAPENQNICSVFLYQESVCQGYTKAMQYLLDKLGICATMVSGYVENGDSHAWNLVKVNGAYYYVDPTWGDAYYKLDQNYEEPAEHLPNINYDYLCVTTDQLSATHTIDNVVPVPRCVQMEDNYYMREGAYFTDCNEARIQELFEQAYEQERGCVTMKCASSAVYAQMRRLLLEEQQVFEYLKDSEGKVAYTDNDAQMTISFWL